MSFLDTHIRMVRTGATVFFPSYKREMKFCEVKWLWTLVLLTSGNAGRASLNPKTQLLGMEASGPAVSCSSWHSREGRRGSRSFNNMLLGSTSLPHRTWLLFAEHSDAEMWVGNPTNSITECKTKDGHFWSTQRRVTNTKPSLWSLLLRSSTTNDMVYHIIWTPFHTFHQLSFLYPPQKWHSSIFWRSPTSLDWHWRTSSPSPTCLYFPALSIFLLLHIPSLIVKESGWPGSFLVLGLCLSLKCLTLRSDKFEFEAKLCN